MLKFLVYIMVILFREIIASFQNPLIRIISHFDGFLEVSQPSCVCNLKEKSIFYAHCIMGKLILIIMRIAHF